MKTELSIVDSMPVEGGLLEFSSELLKALGPKLTEHARKRRATAAMQSMANCAENIYSQIELLEQRIEDEKIRIVQLRERLTDLETGNFKVTKEGQVIFPHLPPPHLP